MSARKGSDHIEGYVHYEPRDKHSKERDTFRAGLASLKRGHLDMALSDLAKLRTQPGLPSDLRFHVEHEYGVALVRAGKTREALELFRNLQREPEYSLDTPNGCAVALNIVGVMFELEDFDSALSELNRLIASPALRQTSSTGSPAYRTRAKILALRHRTREAESDYRIAIRCACDAHDPINAAASAADFARLLIVDLRVREARDWLTLAATAFRRLAAHYLGTIRDLEYLIQPGYAEQIPPVADVDFERMRTLLDPAASPASPDRLSLFDLDLLEFVRRAQQAHGPFRVRIPLHPQMQDAEPLKMMLHDDLSVVVIEEDFAKHLAATTLAKHFGLCEDKIPSPYRLLDSLSRGGPTLEGGSSQYLHWQCADPWPHAFHPLLHNLSAAYVDGWCRSQAPAGTGGGTLGRPPYAPEIAGAIDHKTRALIRPIRARYRGMGEFITGSIPSRPHLAEELARPVLNNPALSSARFQAMGYSPGEATELIAAGLLPLTVDDVKAPSPEATPGSVGALFVDDFSWDNLPGPEPGQAKAGWFIDSHYHSLFRARSLVRNGLYGHRTVCRPKFQPLHSRLEIVDQLRCKQWTVPVVEVSSFKELHNLSARLTSLMDQPCYFRGQPQQYRLQRPAAICRLLFGSDDIVEPSIPGTAPRQGLDFTRVLPFLQLQIQDFMYRGVLSKGEDIDEAHKRWMDFVFGETQREAWDIGVMSIAQHYGIPTHGLDITSSVEIAAWFATNRLVKSENAARRYERLSNADWPRDPRDFPVVYFVSPVTHSITPSITELHSLSELGITALRPERQKALFFTGAHTIHKNRIAEALVCAIRLRPGDWDTGLSYECLFPSETGDDVYALMLDLKQKYANGAFGPFFESIPYFRH
jgi:hypothetical protein